MMVVVRNNNKCHAEKPYNVTRAAVSYLGESQVPHIKITLSLLPACLRACLPEYHMCVCRPLSALLPLNTCSA
ncbi:hypothetical protein Pcinc_010499 [Petrolisthes cinctipes]|uniref:Uncharacterized protein n=1 Tax=Petrolisthes cinctipes TaxID=88211 RepID=A0AAE1G362_PETCI|nr:hypothetical protein Pcinc_010499 [Petrolisthes cinctipes]